MKTAKIRASFGLQERGGYSHRVGKSDEFCGPRLLVQPQDIPLKNPIEKGFSKSWSLKMWTYRQVMQ